MNWRCVVPAALMMAALAVSQSSEVPQVTNPETAKWEKGPKEPADTGSVTLRESEMLVRYPGGHVFAPHWHSGNERIVLIEGRLSIRVGEWHKDLEPGGYAYLPAKQVQEMSCTSSTRCSFYVGWDSQLDFHRASEKP